MARLQIDNDLLAEEFFSDARLLGIQCAAEPHRFVWLVNQHFGYDFRYLQGAEVMLRKKEREFRFPLFGCPEANFSLNHTIYTNQFDGEYLVAELRHTDFLWMLKGDVPGNGFFDLLTAELRAMAPVQLVTELQASKIKNKQHLII